MNTKAMKNAKGGKTYTRVVFLMALNDSNYYEPVAIFPDLYWNYERTEWVSYMHNGQHGGACKAFALLDCILPKPKHLKAVARLKKELEHLDEPYVLEVLDAAEWKASYAEEAKRLEANAKHYELSSESKTAAEEPEPKQADFLDSLFGDDDKILGGEISKIFDEEFGDFAKETDFSYLDDTELIESNEAEEDEVEPIAAEM